MAAEIFLFVDVDDPTGRKKATKPASQRYSKAARKHVMRDIGLARRKVKPGKSPMRHGAGQEPNPAAKSPRAAETTRDAQGRVDPVDNNGMVERAGQEFATIVLQLPEEDMGHCLPMITKQVGCYRQDPFVKYPVEMSDRVRLLLDTRKRSRAYMHMCLDLSLVAASKQLQFCPSTSGHMHTFFRSQMPVC
jgi:hypothetical protein